MIELLDLPKQWARIKAGMRGGNLFKNPPARPHHPFVNGREGITEQAQGTAGSPKGSVFGGKTYSQRKK